MNIRLLTLAAAAVSITACAGSTKMVDQWKAPTHQGPYKKILVFGLAKTQNNRIVFEDQFVASLAQRGIEAVASYKHLPDEGDIPKEKIREVVEAEGFDAALSCKVIKVEKKYASSGGYVYAPPPDANYNNFYGYYGGWTRARLSSSFSENDVLTLETNLYDATSESLAWSARTETFAKGDALKLIDELADVIVSALEESAFVAP